MKTIKQSREIVKLYNKFAEKYGLNLVEDLEQLMGKIYQKMTDVEKSRDMWKEKYMELKNENNN